MRSPVLSRDRRGLGDDPVAEVPNLLPARKYLRIDKVKPAIVIGDDVKQLNKATCIDIIDEIGARQKADAMARNRCAADDRLAIG